MARIEGVPAGKAGLFVRVVYWMARRQMSQLAGRETDRMLEPMEMFARVPRLFFGYGMFEWATGRSHVVGHRLKDLAQLKAATLTNCEYCMLALPTYRTCALFNDLDRLVLDYAVGMSRTPVEVSDELFSALRKHFDDDQLVELTGVIALENLRGRFNLALGIGSSGFSEGMVCAIPDRSPGAP